MTIGSPKKTARRTINNESFESVVVLRQVIIRILLIGSLALYVHLNVIVYRDLIAPIYSYFNLRWVGFSFENQAIASLLTIPIALCLPLICRSFGEFVKWILVFTVFIPSLVVPVASGFVSEQDGPLLNLIIVGSFFALHVTHLAFTKGAVIRLHRPGINSYITLLLIAWALIFAVLIGVNGFSIVRNPFVDIYDARAEFRANVTTQNIFLAYAVPFAAKVVNPLLIVVGLCRKKPLLVVAGVCGSMLIFSANGQKSVFLTIVLIPLVYTVLKRSESVKSIWIACSFTGLALMSFVSPAVMEFIFRRIIITPGLLVGMYIDNYERNGFAYLQHSVLGSWFTSERLPPAREVGLAYWGTPNMAANANFLGDGFANFGFTGMICFAAVLGFVLGLVDRVTKETSFAVTAAASVGVVFALIDTALLTSLVTHGLVAMTILLGMFPEIPKTSDELSFRPRNHMTG